MLAGSAPTLRLSPRGSSRSGQGAVEALLASIPELLQPLTSNDPHVRQAGCQALAQPGLRHETRVVVALLARLQDRDGYVRQAAVSSLGQVARKGDETVVLAMIQRLNDADSSVRRVAANALGLVSPRGNASVLAALLGRLEDKDGGVRRSVIKALEKVTEREDAKVLTALFSRTSDGEAFVRHTAVEVLSRMVEEGNAEVVSKLLELLGSDRDARVRWAATEALGRLAVRGDSRVLNALLARLDDEADSVRRAAANALGHVTFAPLQELELQEKQIADLQFRGTHEVLQREKMIADMSRQHTEHVSRLYARIRELEEKLVTEVEVRDRRISELEAEVQRQALFARVGEFLPHGGAVVQFLDTLPSLAGPSAHGLEIMAPVWALRTLKGSGPLSGAGQARGAHMAAQGPSEDTSAASPAGREKRWLLSLFETFELLAAGAVTAQEMTESRPLDCYVHQSEDGAWGLYCASRQRLLALLMKQACTRNELLMVRCVIRSKEDPTYFSWQWANFYDGTDGLAIEPAQGAMLAIGSCNLGMGSFGPPPTSSLQGLLRSGSCSPKSPRLSPSSSTTRGIGSSSSTPHGSRARLHNIGQGAVLNKGGGGSLRPDGAVFESPVSTEGGQSWPGKSPSRPLSAGSSSRRVPRDRDAFGIPSLPGAKTSVRAALAIATRVASMSGQSSAPAPPRQVPTVNMQLS